jgi:hypothetical protein
LEENQAAQREKKKLCNHNNNNNNNNYDVKFEEPQKHISTNHHFTISQKQTHKKFSSL